MPIPLSLVLCVDDDPDACEMLSELLKLSKITCVCAKSAAEARRLMSLERFDLYLLDAWLPVIDGFEFCRQIRTVDSSTPIIFYSGAAYESDKKKGIDAGANAYMIKPNVEGLVETISRLIAEARIVAIKPRSAGLANLMDAHEHAPALYAVAV